jgi:hypothetical protein
MFQKPLIRFLEKLISCQSTCLPVSKVLFLFWGIYTAIFSEEKVLCLGIVFRHLQWLNLPAFIGKNIYLHYRQTLCVLPVTDTLIFPNQFQFTNIPKLSISNEWYS